MYIDYPFIYSFLEYGFLQNDEISDSSHITFRIGLGYDPSYDMTCIIYALVVVSISATRTWLLPSNPLLEVKIAPRELLAIDFGFQDEVGCHESAPNGRIEFPGCVLEVHRWLETCKHETTQGAKKLTPIGWKYSLFTASK